MLKALVFDFDGVIVDTESQWYDIYKNWLKQDFGYDLQLVDYLVCVGASSKQLFYFLEQEIGKKLNIKDYEDELMKQFIEQSSNLPPMQGVIKLIEEAVQKGLKIAIATSATRRKPEFHLQRLNILKYFDVLSTAELSEHIKPAPDIFIKAAQMLNVTNDECLVIEDSKNGLLGAMRADMKCLIVPNKITKNSDFQGCYKMVDSLSNVVLDQIIEDFLNLN